MRVKAIFILCVAFIMIVPLGALGQNIDGTDWDIETDSSLVFVGDSISGVVYGTNGTFFIVQLVNQTSYVQQMFCRGNVPPDGSMNFTVNITEGAFEPGFYYLNLTVQGHVVGQGVLTIAYNQEYLKSQHEDDQDDNIARNSRGIRTLDGLVRYALDQIHDLEWRDFFIIVFGFYLGLNVFYHTIIPNWRAWNRTKSRKALRHKRLLGLVGDAKTFHDEEPERIPDPLRPNDADLLDVLEKVREGSQDIQQIVSEEEMSIIEKNLVGDVGAHYYLKSLPWIKTKRKQLADKGKAKPKKKLVKKIRKKVNRK